MSVIAARTHTADMYQILKIAFFVAHAENIAVKRVGKIELLSIVETHLQKVEKPDPVYLPGLISS